MATCKGAPFQLQAIGYAGSYTSTIMALEDRPMFLHQVRVVKRGFKNVGPEPSLLSLTRSTSNESELVRAVNSYMLLNGVVFVCNLIRYRVGNLPLHCFKIMLLSVGQWGNF